MASFADNARSFVSNLRGERAIDDLNNEIRRLGLVKKNSSYPPDLNDIEVAIRILYEVLARY